LAISVKLALNRDFQYLGKKNSLRLIAAPLMAAGKTKFAFLKQTSIIVNHSKEKTIKINEGDLGFQGNMQDCNLEQRSLSICALE
jgi:hypothetical protein